MKIKSGDTILLENKVFIKQGKTIRMGGVLAFVDCVIGGKYLCDIVAVENEEVAKKIRIGNSSLLLSKIHITKVV